MQMDGERPNCSLLSRLWHPVVTTAVLDLEPTAHKATQEQAGFYFASLHGNLVGFVTWLLLAVEESELCHPSPAFCEASCGSKGHNWPPALFCFVYLPCLLSQRYEQEEMIRRALSSLWRNLGKDLSHNNASLTCQAETWQLLLSKAAWNVGTKMSLLPCSTCWTKISFQEEYKF